MPDNERRRLLGIPVLDDNEDYTDTSNGVEDLAAAPLANGNPSKTAKAPEQPQASVIPLESTLDSSAWALLQYQVYQALLRSARKMKRLDIPEDIRRDWAHEGIIKAFKAVLSGRFKPDKASLITYAGAILRSHKTIWKLKEAYIHPLTGASQAKYLKKSLKPDAQSADCFPVLSSDNGQSIDDIEKRSELTRFAESLIKLSKPAKIRAQEVIVLLRLLGMAWDPEAKTWLFDEPYKNVDIAEEFIARDQRVRQREAQLILEGKNPDSTESNKALLFYALLPEEQVFDLFLGKKQTRIQPFCEWSNTIKGVKSLIPALRECGRNKLMRYLKKNPHQADLPALFIQKLLKQQALEQAPSK